MFSIAMNRLISIGFLLVFAANSISAQTPWQAGFSQVDVTPTEPVRMSGYGSRDHASEGIDTPLYVRAIALKHQTDRGTQILLAVDNIGLPGAMTRELASQLQRSHGLSREQVVFCSTHTHCGPDLVSELSNIFATPLSPQEEDAGVRYRQQLVKGILQAVDESIKKLEAVHLHYAVGEANFAANRRVLKNGRWSGFGVQADGSVDHSVPTLRVTGIDGKVRGMVFNYACHCTTLGGNHYHINGDWAGYATLQLESKYPDAVALCTIGCGADANPDPRGTLDATKIHGRTLATEVIRIVESEMEAIDQPVDTRFDYAAASFDLPTQEELKSRLDGGDVQTRRHAQQMLDVLKQHGRLPATYPIPIQTWQFGDQMTMVFLGGEVVVDYALRLKKELDDPNLWVTAYANDVLGYVPSEKMRLEGGYEYDRSGIYYRLPGPWAGGTEDLLVSRIHEVLKSRGRSQPTSAEQSLDTFQITDGYQIELIAAEPLVEDPINMAFDQRGRLWVVEMGDYPEGENGGRIKVLVDQNQDGRFDTATTYLDDLSFPTGVFPWRDGVLISSAPDILFARDLDGDDRADEVKKLYTGFRLANPQHRIGGFSYGLDHSLHLSSGDNLGELTSRKTGEVINASGHDVQLWPDTGRFAVTSGRTQFIRSRNDWGQWFGNDNSRPMYHFPIDDAYLGRNEALKLSGGSQQLFDPPVAPPVFPKTAATERFNDLFAANRFTSACSAIVARSPEFAVDSKHDVAFICEPVHNLVHRTMLIPAGSSYRAARSTSEQRNEFLTSSDPWFRPARVLIGPDGHLYIADMYRETIEHPEWIPDAWQAQLDLRAGADRGRIYRVSKIDGQSVTKDVNGDATTKQLVDALRSQIGPTRDLTQQWLLERDDPITWPLLKSLAKDATVPHAQVHALSILDLKNKLDKSLLISALQSNHAGVLITAIRLTEKRFNSAAAEQILQQLPPLASHANPQVRLQLALTLGQSNDPQAAKMLAKLVRNGNLDRWLIQAISSSAGLHATAILDDLFSETHVDKLASIPAALLTNLLSTAESRGVNVATRYGKLFATTKIDEPQQLQLAACFTNALKEHPASQHPLREQLEPLYEQAKRWINDTDRAESHRKAALNLLGIGIGSKEEEKQLLLDLVSPQTPLVLQQDAIERLSRLGDASTCVAFVDRWASMSDAVRSQCVGQILQRRNWIEILLDALEQGTIQAADLSPAARQQLTQTGSRSMRVRANRLVAIKESLGKRELINHYRDQMGNRGDRTRGAKLFQQHCAVCHVAKDQTAAVGASLQNLTDRSEATLLTAILDPNRAIDPQYQSYLVRTQDDRILMGIIEQEAGQSITLAHADGRRTTLRRDQITELKNSGTSLMPEGFQDTLPPQTMRDLIEYLQNQ
jgi:putative membrane-bound dehydrogenase-like protein